MHHVQSRADGATVFIAGCCRFQFKGQTGAKLPPDQNISALSSARKGRYLKAIPEVVLIGIDPRRKAVGVERIFLPGEIEADKADASQSRGIEVDSQIVEKINVLLEKKDLAVRIEKN